MVRRFYVYVVELRPSHLGGSTRDVYVGSSFLPPEQRFQKHLNGERASKHVKNRGVRLLPHLYNNLNPCDSRQEAKRKELYLRRKLEKKGYNVFGACSRLESGDCWIN